MAASLTPVMQQHAAAKRAHPDAIVFFRLGDFYEMFGEDAILASRLLDLTLTSRNKGKPDEVPMAGVPHHAAHVYVAKLLGSGHRVAICEQMADPSKVKGIVPREVVRVITPGLVTQDEQLEATKNNWLAALEESPSGVGIALLDVSTGELLAAVMPDLAALLGELARTSPREVLLSSAAGGELQATRAAVQVVLPGAAVRTERVEPLARERALEPVRHDAEALDQVAQSAVAHVLAFARACHPRSELPVWRIGRWDPASVLRIDPATQSHLELVGAASGERAESLLGTIDLTLTPGGARLLRRRLLAPLVDVERIRRRLDAVEVFVVASALRAEVRERMKRVGDLERLAVRTELGEATPRDLGALRDGLAAAREVVARVVTELNLADRQALGLNARPPDCVEELAEVLASALVERPPAQPKESGVFRPGYDSELDELDVLRRHGAERMTELEGRLRAELGLGNLKVRFTRVFGWYIEVTRAQSSRVPKDWRRKQTVASGERYTLPELDELADRITGAEEQHRERELELLRSLVGLSAQASERVRSLAGMLARWDVALALAELAHRHDYARPKVEDSELLEIRDGRHPVVERHAALGRFVPNDVDLDTAGDRLWLVTGPNMAGKSTFLRQVSLIVILAQMGSYVPARSARIGVVDRVLSRVGASDNLARGESTFMVEMRETAAILRSATRRSLVVLDEIGRGTSTFDGLAIAWAVAEHLHDAVRCRVLFATHYHELTVFAEAARHAANYSVSARELDGDVVFLHRVTRGAASRSYGVAVAKLAGLPEPVLARARAVLAALENGTGPELTVPKKRDAMGGPGPEQLGLFARGGVDAGGVSVLETLRGLEVDRLSGLEALQLLSQLKSKL